MSQLADVIETDLDTDLVWLSIVRLESSVAPRILTLSESGIAVSISYVFVGL